MRILLLAGLGLVLAACSVAQPPADSADNKSAATDKSKRDADDADDDDADDDDGDDDDKGDAPTISVDELARHKAELMTSIWENGTTVMQYSYCEDIKDGRGYTSGRAGFCSGTGDALLVAKCVAKAAPKAKMAKYVSALQKLEDTFESSGEDQASTASLDKVGSYCADWAADATGEVADAFKKCQDQVVEEQYFEPTKTIMAKNHLKSALTLAALYDCAINQGLEGDNQAPGLEQLVAKATKQAGTDDESKWLEAFLEIRLDLLASNETWADAVDRVANYEKLRRDGNFDLTKPITTNAKAATLFPGKNLKDNEYPSCGIAGNGAVSGDADCTSATPTDGDDDDDDTGDDDTGDDDDGDDDDDDN